MADPCGGGPDMKNKVGLVGRDEQVKIQERGRDADILVCSRVVIEAMSFSPYAGWVAGVCLQHQAVWMPGCIRFGEQVISGLLRRWGSCVIGCCWCT